MLAKHTFLAFIVYMSSIVISAQNIDSAVLDQINVSPNPYYGYTDKGKVKNGTITISNLVPSLTEVKIYAITGILVKKFEKETVSNILVWDLKNEKKRKIKSGIYLIHINITDVGERIIKIMVMQKPPR